MVLLGHNINEKQPTRIFTPAASLGQVPQEVENKPDILVSKYSKRNGFRSRLVAVNSEVLYSQKENTLDKHNDLPQKLFEKEINESEKIKKSLASGVLPNPENDPLFPTKQIIIYTRSRRPGELLENNSFNDWQNNTPCKWKSDNVSRTREALTGSYAVRLGSNPEKKAYLYQDIVALPGYFYEIKCNFKMPVAHARSPAIKLLWLNSNTEIIEYGMNISITTGEKPYYQFVTGITTKSPSNVVYGRVYFEKHDTGVLDIDTVSFICF